MEKNKTGVVFAWIMLIILIAFAGLLVYVKNFMPKENDNPIVEKPNDSKNIPTLTYIKESFQNSPTAQEIQKSGGNVSVKIHDENTLIFTVQTIEVTQNVSAVLTNNVISVEIEKNNIEALLPMYIFEGIVETTATYYNQNMSEVNDTIIHWNTFEYEVPELKAEEKDISMTLSIDISKPLTLYKPKEIYNSFTLIDIGNEDYQIHMNDYIIHYGLVEYFEEYDSTSFNVAITNTLNDERVAQISYKLYDENNNIIYEDDFDVEFTTEQNFWQYSSTTANDVDYNKIKKYSITIE